ncbi:MAG: DNA translocase FtsK, partial [Firmicutes bacterium]|nr:DNA translocase FtsK [Bacillota bacterium]
NDFASKMYYGDTTVGGVLFGSVAFGLAKLLTPIGATIVCLLATTGCLFGFAGKSPRAIIDRLRNQNPERVGLGSGVQPLTYLTPNEFEMGQFGASPIVPQTEQALFVEKLQPLQNQPLFLQAPSTQPMQQGAWAPSHTSAESLSLFGTTPFESVSNPNAAVVDNRASQMHTDARFGTMYPEENILSEEERRAIAQRELQERKEQAEKDFANTSFSFARFSGSPQSTHTEPTVGSSLSIDNLATSGFGFGSGVGQTRATQRLESAITQTAMPQKFVHGGAAANGFKLSGMIAANPATLPQEVDYYNDEGILNADQIVGMETPQRGVSSTEQDVPTAIQSKYIHFASVETPALQAKVKVQPKSEMTHNLEKLFGSASLVRNPVVDEPILNGELFFEKDKVVDKEPAPVVQQVAQEEQSPILSVSSFASETETKKTTESKTEGLNIPPIDPNLFHFLEGQKAPAKPEKQATPKVAQKKQSEELSQGFDFLSNFPKYEDAFEQVEQEPIQTGWEEEQESRANQEFENLLALESFKKQRDSYEDSLDSIDAYDDAEDLLDTESTAEIARAPEQDFSGYYNYLDQNTTITPLSPEAMLPLSLGEVGTRKARNSRIGASKMNTVQTQMDDVLGVDTKKKSSRKKRTQYIKPNISLLANLSTDTFENSDHINANGDLLVKALTDLGLPVELLDIVVGPSVTRYEISVPMGTSVKKIEQFAEDIQYALACNGKIRIETPILGKRAIGVEVPNDVVATVGLKAIIESRAFVDSKHPLTVALGKDIGGDYIVANIAKMPHLLIAGATGSGKSACLNSMITSLLYKSTPEEVRIVLIDPKRVEFSIYAHLPNLLIKDIITEPEHAVNALDYMIGEMNHRYAIFNAHNAKSLDEYNNCQAVADGLEPKLPYIVIIVDELADLMMASKRVVEDKIRALTQKSRASGIHLVLATQRPSVDVVTGTIKSNLPTRIAFSVTNFQDSKTILDGSGAENLLGKGDMLYMSPDSSTAKRIQGAYITNEEVKSVVAFCKENNECEYNESVADAIVRHKEQESGNTMGRVERDQNSTDIEFENALYYAISKGQISTSKIQSVFEMGYARAGRIISQMEKRGYISEGDGAKPRTVLLSMEQFERLYPETVARNRF